MRRLTEHEMKEKGLRLDAWEAGLFRWLWDGNTPVRFFHSDTCYAKWKEKEQEAKTDGVESCPVCGNAIVDIGYSEHFDKSSAFCPDCGFEMEGQVDMETIRKLWNSIDRSDQFSVED